MENDIIAVSLFFTWTQQPFTFLEKGICLSRALFNPLFCAPESDMPRDC